MLVGLILILVSPAVWLVKVINYKSLVLDLG